MQSDSFENMVPGFQEARMRASIVLEEGESVTFEEE